MGKTPRRPRPKKEFGRFTSKRKREAVLRLFAGEDLDTLAREYGVTAARLSQWRDAFLEAGEAALRSRKKDTRDDEIDRLKRMVGELTMEKELLTELQHLQEGRSRPWMRRSRP